MNRKLLLFTAVVFSLVTAQTVFAASICPIITGGGAGGVSVSPAYVAGSGVTNGGCNVLITFNLNGSITTTFPNPAPSYDDGLDDNLVGILNNSLNPLSSVTLTGTTGPFSFDGDGACDPTWIFSGGNPCGTTTSGYGPQGVTFSGISANFNTGTVNFATPIAAGGGSNWFSLEGPVDLNLVVNGPEPGSLVLLTTGLFAVVWRLRRGNQRSRG